MTRRMRSSMAWSVIVGAAIDFRTKRATATFPGNSATLMAPRSGNSASTRPSLTQEGPNTYTTDTSPDSTASRPSSSLVKRVNSNRQSPSKPP